jgi:hypothetical protein
MVKGDINMLELLGQCINCVELHTMNCSGQTEGTKPDCFKHKDAPVIKTYEAMIPDHFIGGIKGTSEEDATKNLLADLRKLFKDGADEEIINEFGLLLWETI